eukprot:Clim_evm42s232 gene=Clim_evmTU42s232
MLSVRSAGVLVRKSVTKALGLPCARNFTTGTEPTGTLKAYHIVWHGTSAGNLYKIISSRAVSLRNGSEPSDEFQPLWVSSDPGLATVAAYNHLKTGKKPDLPVILQLRIPDNANFIADQEYVRGTGQLSSPREIWDNYGSAGIISAGTANEVDENGMAAGITIESIKEVRMPDLPLTSDRKLFELNRRHQPREFYISDVLTPVDSDSWFIARSLVRALLRIPLEDPEGVSADKELYDERLMMARNLSKLADIDEPATLRIVQDLEDFVQSSDDADVVADWMKMIEKKYLPRVLQKMPTWKQILSSMDTKQMVLDPEYLNTYLRGEFESRTGVSPNQS